MRSRIPLLLVAGAVALGVTLVIVSRSPAVRAGPPPPVTVLDAVALRDTGRALTLAARSIEGVPLVEAVPAGSVRAPRLLAAAPDGMTLAVSTVEVGATGPLTLARADGSQLEIQLPGVRGAAFEPGGTWLAAVDLSGALWRVRTASGAAARLADGPYASDLSVLPDGRILAIRVSAVDAPLWAAAETVDTEGVEVPLGGSLAVEAQLVYSATPLSNAGIALVRHRLGGGVAIVRLDEQGDETVLTELGGAAGVAVSPDGSRLAWPAAGTTWLASVDAPDEALAIGDGTPARFSPDGSLLIVYGADASAIIDRVGERIDRAGKDACWVGGGRGCRP